MNFNNITKYIYKTFLFFKTLFIKSFSFSFETYIFISSAGE